MEEEDETEYFSTNDVKLGAWILDNCSRSSAEISAFNRKMKSSWQSKMPRDAFSKHRRKLAQQSEDRRLAAFFPERWFWKKWFRR